VTSIIKIDIDPVLFRIGGFSVHWYGVMYVVGIVVALMVVLPFVEARGIKRDLALEIFFPIVIAGLVGGRLYYVVQSNLGYYLSNPLKILATWEGGMAFFGAIIGASLMIFYLAWRRKLPLWTLLDAGAIFAPLGQAFGRVGNIVNGDIVGYRSSCAWCTEYVNPNSFAQRGIPYQPAAAYELLISLAIFAVIYSLRFKTTRAGLLFALYLMLYSFSQFCIFFVRAEPVTALGLKQAQLTAIVTFAAGVALFAYLQRHGQMIRQTAPVPQDAASEHTAQPEVT
jgi:phosphatidylglycerol---prolipoprotein diacylglyceryl transferase